MTKKGNNKSAIRTDKDKKVARKNRAIYSATDPTTAYPSGIGLVSIPLRAGAALFNPDEMQYEVTDLVADAAWRKRLGLSYDDNLLIENKDGTYRLPKNVEMEIPTDTTFIKNRIAANKRLANQSNIMGEDWKLVDSMIDLDSKTLEALRKTYSTGEPVVINEYSNNSRRLAKDGELVEGAHDYKTPLNVLQNFTIQYDPVSNTMKYRDTYDFNGFEFAVPGEPFEISGSVPLKAKGGRIYRTNKYSLGAWLNKTKENLTNWNTNVTLDLMNSKFGNLLGKVGVKSGNLGSIANTAATAIGGVLADGRTTGVGNAMLTVGSLASNIPGVGGLIGAGVNLIGGIVNAGFGSKLNQENINNVNSSINQAMQFTSNAGDFDALASNVAGMQGVMGFDKDYIGKDGWWGGSKAKRKYNELKRKAEEAEQYQYNTLDNNAQNIANTNLQLMEANYNAYGGPIDMKYTGVMSPFGNRFDDGGIYIKPSKRGTFTTAAKKRGMGVQEFASKVLANKEDYSPAMVKKANFARNASKWKHADGGPIEEQAILDKISSSIAKVKAMVGAPNQFYDSWNQARLDTGLYDSQLGDGKLLRQKQDRDSTPVFNNINTASKVGALRGTYFTRKSKEEPIQDAVERYNEDLKANSKFIYNQLKSPEEGKERLGFYLNGPKILFYKSDHPETLIHEQAHASKAREQEAKIAEILGDRTNYLDRATEVYARLMQLREANQNILRPDKIVTSEDLDWLKDFGTDFNILHRYDEDKVLRILNEVADAGDIKDNGLLDDGLSDVYMSAYGGFLRSNKKADGGNLFTNGVTTIDNGGTHEYLEGQEYDVTEEEIKLLKKLGYEFEYL